MIQPRFKLFMEHWLSESVEFISASDFGPLDKAWATTADQRNCSDNFQHCTVLLLNRAQQMEQKSSTSTCKRGSHTFYPQSSNKYATAKVAKSSTQLLDISTRLLSRMHQFLAQCQQLRPETLHFTALFLHGRKNWVASRSKESFWKFTLPGWYLENSDVFQKKKWKLLAIFFTSPFYTSSLCYIFFEAFQRYLHRADLRARALGASKAIAHHSGEDGKMFSLNSETLPRPKAKGVMPKVFNFHHLKRNLFSCEQNLRNGFHCFHHDSLTRCPKAFAHKRSQTALCSTSRVTVESTQSAATWWRLGILNWDCFWRK